MTYELGIDLGTTWTAAAVWRGERPTIVNLGTRQAAIPSVVYVGPDGTVLVGEAAERRVLTEPERVARQFKRRIGDPAPILIGGAPHSAELLTSKLLRAVVDAVAGREGEMPSTITITHPANWGAYKKDLLEQAVHLAELSGPGKPAIRLLSEPEAAAIHYAGTERVEPGQTVAVYDLGGGTFDVAVLRSTGDSFVILGAPEGIERLGGIDFDAAVLGHVARTLGGLDDLDPDDPSVATAVAHLRDQCTAAKEALSVDSQTIVPILLPGRHTEVRLTRPELEAMLRPALDETIAATTRALRTAGVAGDDLRAVVLVGGSSRIPLVAQLVTSALGRPVAVDTDPKHAIALGAARHAHLTAAGPGAITSPSRQTAQGLERAQADKAAAMPLVAPPPPPAHSTPPPTATRPPTATPPPAPPPTSTILPSPVAAPPPPPEPPTPTGRPRGKRWLIAAAAAVVVAVLAAGFVVSRGGSDDDGSGAEASADLGASTTAVDGEDDGADADTARIETLQSGLLSSLDLNTVAGQMNLVGEVSFPSDVLCDAEGVIDTSNFVHYESRLFSDSPDFDGKKAAVGAIEFPDSAEADEFLNALIQFGASHVISDSCPLNPVDFDDGTVAFAEVVPDVATQGAIGFAKVDPDVVVFAAFGDPTGMDPSDVQLLVQMQRLKMVSTLQGDGSESPDDGGGAASVQALTAALLTPDDVGAALEQQITAFDPERDYLCFSNASADRSSATEAAERLIAADGNSEIAVLTLAFPDDGASNDYFATTEAFLAENFAGGCQLTEQPTGSLDADAGLDDSFTYTFDTALGRAQATFGVVSNVAVVVIANPLATGNVDSLMATQVQRLRDAGIIV